MVSTIYDDDIEFMMRIRYRYRVYIIIMMRNVALKVIEFDQLSSSFYVETFLRHLAAGGLR